MPESHLNHEQIIREVYALAANALRVSGGVGISDGASTATITDVAGKKSLDVNVTAITLSDTDDSIAIGDGTGRKALFTENGALATGNAVKKFRDGFASLAQNAQADSSIWTTSIQNQGSTTIGRRGNAAGSAYMQMSMCPITVDSEVVLESVRTFKYPMRYMIGTSFSQRIVGQEFEISIVGTDGSSVETLTPIADMDISGAISVTSNVATINFATNHPYKGGDRVILKNNTDTRMNVGPILVTVVTPTQITVPITITTASYTAGGKVAWTDTTNFALNSVGMLFENATVTSATWFTRRNGYNTRLVNSTVASQTATQSNTSPHSDAFNAVARHEFTFNQEESFFISRSQDSLSVPTGNARWTQGIPDEEKDYKLRIRAKNLANLTRPIAKITAIAKTGTTTATVTTDVAHGLSTSSFVQIYGVRDQTNFPNLTAQTQVASIVSSTQFTIVIGTASTTSSAGGGVWLNQGGVTAPGIFAQVVQSISRTNNVLTLVGNTTWATPLPGENIHLYGCDATSMGLYDGAYKVLRVNTTSLEVESVGGGFTTINCGGAVIRRTDFRVHFVSEIEHTRHIVELNNQNGAADGAKAIPIVVNSGIVSTVSAVTAANLALPGTIADIASAALTTTTTTSAITPTFGTAYQVNIPVTAVSGTSPTLDVAIEESTDSGTNWFKVYDFPRITATGMYNSPILMMRGNRVRYVQTVTGTSPSFTRSLNRLQISHAATQNVQIIDRTIVPNTLNSTSPTILVEGCQDFNINVRCTAQTTAATIALQFSHNNTNWFTTATTLTTAVDTVQAKATNEQWKFARLIVTAAGTGITLGEAMITGTGR